MESPRTSKLIVTPKIDPKAYTRALALWIEQADRLWEEARAQRQGPQRAA